MEKVLEFDDKGNGWLIFPFLCLAFLVQNLDVFGQ